MSARVRIYDRAGTVLREVGFVRGTIARKCQAFRQRGYPDARLRTRKEAIAEARRAGEIARFEEAPTQ